MVRTTLDLDDQVLAAARSLAAERQISLGAAVSELARRGLQDGGSTSIEGLPVFDVADDARVITPEMVDAALDD